MAILLRQAALARDAADENAANCDNLHCSIITQHNSCKTEEDAAIDQEEHSRVTCWVEASE